MSRISNRQVVEELKNGDRRGCEHLVELYQRLLIHESIRTFSLERRDAEELVSDVLLSVVQKIDQFSFRKSESDFHYWIMAVFRNRVRDYCRRRALSGGRESVFSEFIHRLDEEEFSDLFSPSAWTVAEDGFPADGGPTNGRQQRLKSLMELLDALEAWERILLRCRAMDVPFEEIARYTGKPVSQLKVYHARVRKKLIRMLSERYPELQAV